MLFAGDGRCSEAERARRAKVIHAEGEYMGAEKLSMAAEKIQQQPVAIELRYLQTLVEIGAEKNSTVVSPMPVDLLTSTNTLIRNVAEREGKAS
jgi:regulator of protease activity HflC (stomatin/prohibitin superfamily)